MLMRHTFPAHTLSPMERSRLLSPSKKLLRHTPRNQTRRLGAVYVLSTILLLFCMLAIFHSKLSAANSSSLARLFVSPITERAPDFTSLKLRNGTIVRKVAARKLGKRTGSRLSTQGRVKDADIGTGFRAVADLGIAEDLEDNEQHHQNDLDEIEREDNAAKDKQGDSVDGGNWDGIILPARMSTRVRDRMTIGKVLSGSAQGVSQPIKKHVWAAKTLPRWDPLENIGDRGQIGKIERDNFRWKSPRLPGMKWDHLLGVVRQMGSVQSSSPLLQSTKAMLYFDFPDFRDLRDTSLDKIHNFGSDDEPLHQYVINNLEKIASIDDALLFSVEKSRNVTLRSWTDKKLRSDTYKKERSSKGVLDSLNPMNNPLLQDPDTSSPNGLSGYDKVMLKALRKANARPSLEAEHGNADTSRDTFATVGKNKKTSEIAADSNRLLGNAAE